MTQRPSSWSDAVLIAALLALDYQRAGGLHLRGASGPERDAWLELLTRLARKGLPFRRCPARIDEERLFGGLDLTASLASNTAVLHRGLLSDTDTGIVVFTLADCLPTGLGVQIAHVFDQKVVTIARDGISTTLSAQFGYILLDEGYTTEERAPDALVERCGFRLETKTLRGLDKEHSRPARAAIDAARKVLERCEPVADDIITALVETAMAFGITSLRPALYALNTAHMLAALDMRTQVTFDDANLAARLVFSHKATRNPTQDESEAEASDTQAQDPPTEGGDDQTMDTVQEEPPSDAQNPDHQPSQPPSNQLPTADIMIEIVKSALPAELIAALLSESGPIARSRDRDGGGAGDIIASTKRGRPVGSRRGALRAGQRIHLIDTLRAAAPWQRVRIAEMQRLPLATKRVHVRSDDIRVRRYVEKRETSIVFAVDASGSSAWQRLAEAKGAVQLMLAHAYRSRARVALVSFRNESADVILPPTRSLTRARRLLGDLVGGGGTPLAKGLQVALKLALDERAKGRTARLLVLTDGQGNVALDGSHGRQKALADALTIAGHVRLSGLQTIHIDTASRPQAQSQDLARKMGATYAPLPRPGSREVVGAMASLLE